MDQDKNKFKVNIISGVIFWTISLITGTFFYLFNSIILLLLTIFGFLLGVSAFTRHIQTNITIRMFDFIFGWILGIMWISATILVSFLLIILAALITWMLITLLFSGLLWVVIFLGVGIDVSQFEKPILYISILITAVSLSYYGEGIIYLFDRLSRVSATNSTDTPKNLALFIIRHINLRRRTYELSIILYIFSVFERLSETEILRYKLWIEYKTVALEVLITLVAIDTYLRNYKKFDSDNR